MIVKIDGTTMISEKERVFCDEYIRTASITGAAFKAGYGITSYSTAWSAGHRLLQTERISSFINQELSKIREPIVETMKLALLNNLHEVTQAKISDILEEDGSFKPTSEWPESVSKNVTSYQYVTDANGRVQARMVLADPIRAYGELVKLLSISPDPNSTKLVLDIPVNPRPVEDTLKNIYQSLSPELREEVVGTPSQLLRLVENTNENDESTEKEITEDTQLELDFGSPPRKPRPNITKKSNSPITPTKKSRIFKIKKSKISPLTTKTKTGVMK